jgi:hypothetical protein
MIGGKLVSAEAVTQRAPVAHDRVRAELVVVVDQVEPDFRANKDIVPDVSTNASSEVPHEMIATAVASASEEVIAIGNPIEPNVFAPNSGQQFSCKILTQLRSPDGIEGVEQRAVGLGSGSAI